MNEEKNQTYIILDQMDSSNNELNAPIRSISKHPARFTVHLPADLSKFGIKNRIIFEVFFLDSPYRSTMEVTEEDDDDHEILPSTNT